ncbi:MAG: hypothetical protein JEZ06_10780 [Anaerolineaceae bacterium]|nr:hypothetical protein [Anaerolineaceae bacterium]
MKSTDAKPPYETLEIATPRDYTSDMYRFYFEVGEYQGSAKTIIQDFLGPEKSKSLVSLPHGYEIELAIQCVPDLIQNLVNDGIGIYQVIRYAKLAKDWD